MGPHRRVNSLSAMNPMPRLIIVAKSGSRHTIRNYFATAAFILDIAIILKSEWLGVVLYRYLGDGARRLRRKMLDIQNFRQAFAC